MTSLHDMKVAEDDCNGMTGEGIALSNSEDSSTGMIVNSRSGGCIERLNLSTGTDGLDVEI